MPAAAKHFDPIVGIDVHIIQPPGPVPPVPVPHPHTGVLWDAFDYAPYIGGKVFVGGIMRAQAGTAGKAIPKHIPIGGVFVKPPANESEMFMGSKTVSVDGDAFSYLSLPVISCHCVGSPPIPRLKGSSPKSMVLPTTVVMAIPAQVNVGGSPTISLMALGFRLGLAVLGALWRKGKKAWKARKARRAQNGVKCAGGHPVDIITGANYDDFLDAKAPEPSLFEWRRYYTTARARQSGPLGYGFRHSYDHRLRLYRQAWIYEDHQGRETLFPPLRKDQDEVVHNGLVLRRTPEGRLEISDRDRPVLVFEARAGRKDARLRFVRSGDRSLELIYTKGRLTELSEHALGETPVRYALHYDGDGHILEVRRRDAGHLALLAAYVYDRRGRLTTSQDAAGGRHEYTYDDGNRWLVMREPRGFAFTWAYDGNGRCIEATGQNDLWWTSFEYDEKARETRVIDRKGGGVAVYKYDEGYTLRELVDPYGGVLSREADEDGRVVREVDPSGEVTTWIYDENGAPLGVMDAQGFVSPPECELPDPGDPAALELPSTPVGYEWGGSLPALDAGLGASRHSPLLGQLPDGVRGAAAIALRLRDDDAPEYPADSVRRYDDLGRLVEEIDGLGRRRAWSYDPAGNEVWRRDRDGREHEQRIVSWNLVGEEVDPLGHATKFEYGPTESVTAIVDPGGTRSDYDYDDKDRLVRVRRHGRTRDEYAYDLGNRVVEKRNGEGAPLLRYEYGKDGLCSSRILTEGGTQRFAWDSRGRLTNASTDEHDVELRRDSFDRPLKDARDAKGVEHVYSGGRVFSTCLFDRFTTRYHRSESGDVTEIVDPTGGVHRLRAERGVLVVRDASNGTSELSQYDDDGRLEGRVAWKLASDGTLETWAARYQYSAEGDLAFVIDTARGKTVYETDLAHGLVAEDGPGGRREFLRDPAGNLLAKPGLTGVVLDDGNRLRHANGETFVYNIRNHIDERFGFTGKHVRYVYDSLDQLVAIEEEGKERWTAAYDGMGRRIRCGRGETQTFFYWDADRLAAEVAPSGRLRVYLYAGHEALVPFGFVDYDSDHADPSSGRVYSVFTNQLGAPLRVEGENGRVVWWADRIDPYGHTEVQPASEIDFALRWPGHYYDEDTGLHYNRFRYYDPTLGRYLQSDPIGQSGGVNLYSYAPNPVVDVDLLGLAHKGKAKSKKPKKASPDAEIPRKVSNAPKGSKLSDGTPMPPGTKKIEYGKPVTATYYVDAKGRTIRAEGKLDPPAVYKKEGVGHIKPEGFKSGRDHRGHLIPERGAKNADAVNVRENVIAEHGKKSNLGPKKKWENRANAHAADNPGCTSVHEPKYKGDSMRPHEVVHDLKGPDGKSVPGFKTTIPNPTR